MISFRYHAFTVVAIFLAVALGIAIGNTGLSRSVVVRGLERQTEELQQQLDETLAEQRRLYAEGRRELIGALLKEHGLLDTAQIESICRSLEQEVRDDLIEGYRILFPLGRGAMALVPEDTR